MSMALRIDNDSHPLFWGAMPGGGDGWASSGARDDAGCVYRWSPDTPMASALANGLPVCVRDLHGREHWLHDQGAASVVMDARWYCGGDELARLVPWQGGCDA